MIAASVFFCSGDRITAMAEWHLTELRNELEKKGWRIIAEHPSPNLYISGSWEVQRNPSMASIFIDFEGIDDLNTLPMNESYGCNIRNHEPSGLYFSKRGEKSDSNKRKIWKSNLTDFVKQLDLPDARTGEPVMDQSKF
jgi:hypothetical protein